MNNPDRDRALHVQLLTSGVPIADKEAFEWACGTWDPGTPSRRGRYRGFTRLAFRQTGEFLRSADAVANEGGDIWIGMAIRRCPSGRAVGNCECEKPFDKDHVAALLGVFADVDVKPGRYDSRDAALGAVRDVPIPPTYIVDSGGGFQPVYLFEKPLPDLKRGEELLRRIRDRFRTDPTVDCTRVLRLAGTQNHKYGPNGRPTRLIDVTRRRYSPDDVAAAFRARPSGSAGSSRPQRRVKASAQPSKCRPLRRLRAKLGCTYRAVLDKSGRDAYPSASEADNAVVFAMVHRGFTNTEIWKVLKSSPRWSHRIRRKGEQHTIELYSNEIRTARNLISKGGRQPRDLKRLVKFPLTDTGNAEVFAYLNAQHLRFDHRRHHWLVWRGHRWATDGNGHARSLLKKAARLRYEAAGQVSQLDQRTQIAKWAIKSESRGHLEAALRLARDERPLSDAGDHWDEDPWLLGVANGVVDLQTGHLRPGRRSDRITMQTPIEFDPDARCRRWKCFLEEVFGGDAALIGWIQRAIGYSLTGITREQVHFICYGVGCNGKTTLLRVVREVAGDYGDNTPFSTLERNGRSSIPNDLAALFNKRVVTASELNDAVKLNEARLKLLAGEDPVTARFLHREFFTFQPVAKFWLAVNHKPAVQDDSTGFWRKIRLIPFTQDFQGREDRELEAALREEYPGILAWAVRGCLRYQKCGLEPPKVIRAATAAYRQESDHLGAFLAACTIGDAAGKVAAGELHRVYQTWAKREALSDEERLGPRTFGEKLGERLTKKTTKTGRYYLGISVAADWASAAKSSGAGA